MAEAEGLGSREPSDLGSAAAGGERPPGGQERPRRFSVGSGSSLNTLGPTDGIVQVSPDGKGLIATGYDKDGRVLDDKTLTGLFLSGRLTHLASPDHLATIKEDGDDQGDEVALCYFPDPPCVFPPDEDEQQEEDANSRPSVADYWKDHTQSFDVWPKVAMMRDIHQQFMKAIGGGRTRTSSIMSNKIFVNVTPGNVGVRASPTTSDLEKTGESIESGQMVTVRDCEDRDGIRYWKLREMTGYIFETKDSLRVMQEAMNVETGTWWYRVACSECIEVRCGPGYGNELRSGWVLSPGELVVIGLRCRIGSAQFLLLKDGRGWVFTWKPTVCGAGHLRASTEAAMEECSTDFLELGATMDFKRAIPPTDQVVEVGSWTFVVQQRPCLCLGSKQHGTFLSPGDIFRVDKKVTASGGVHQGKNLQERVWVRLSDGRGWVPIWTDDGYEQIKEQDPHDLTYPSWFIGNSSLDEPQQSWMVGFA